jgi:hypothetical protein
MKLLSRQGWYAAAPAGTVAFWGGLWMAAERYPSEYDWRYMVISSLLNPDRNPDGFGWAWAGLAVCAVGGLCWSGVLVRDWKERGAVRRPAGVRALGLGYICMVCALMPSSLLPVPKGHEILALTSFLSLCAGIVSLFFQGAERTIRLRTPGLPGGPRLCAAVLAGCALAPIFSAAIASAYVSHVHLPWVSLAWRARGIPAFLSFAFWEWTTCAVFSAYVAALCLVSELRSPGLHSGLEAAAAPVPPG